jgi:two-component system invasion response regulator UvrY
LIRVLVVDDHQLVRSGTTRLLSDASDIEIVGEAESGEGAIKLVRELKPDVVLMDVRASGYLTKKADVDEMTRAIRKVMAGQRYISSEIAQQLALAPYSEGDNQIFTSLSKREMQIVLMTVNGLSPSEIADLLSLSPKTVSSYRHRIFEKLDIKNDVGLMKLAIQYGIIDLDSAADPS